MPSYPHILFKQHTEADLEPRAWRTPAMHYFIVHALLYSLHLHRDMDNREYPKSKHGYPNQGGTFIRSREAEDFPRIGSRIGSM